MAVEVIDSTIQRVVDGTSLVVTKPTCAVGDVLFVFRAKDNSVFIKLDDMGLTAIGNESYGSYRIESFYRVVTGDEPASWTLPRSATWQTATDIVAVMAVRGCNLETPAGEYSGSVTIQSTSIVIPTLTMDEPASASLVIASRHTASANAFDGLDNGHSVIDTLDNAGSEALSSIVGFNDTPSNPTGTTEADNDITDSTWTSTFNQEIRSSVEPELRASSAGLGVEIDSRTALVSGAGQMVEYYHPDNARLYSSVGLSIEQYQKPAMASSLGLMVELFDGWTLEGRAPLERVVTEEAYGNSPLERLVTYDLEGDGPLEREVLNDLFADAPLERLVDSMWWREIRPQYSLDFKKKRPIK